MPTRTAEQQRAEKLLERIRERRASPAVIGEHQDDLAAPFVGDAIGHSPTDSGIGGIEAGISESAGLEYLTGNNTGNAAGRNNGRTYDRSGDVDTEKPTGIDFDIPPIEFDTEPEPLPEKPAKKGKPAVRKAEVAVPTAQSQVTTSAPGQDKSLLSKLRSHSYDGALTNAEAAERTDSAVQVATLIGQILDAGLEALRKTHAETDVFEPDDEEAKMLAEWYLRRARTRPKTAKRVRVVTDLYDTYAVPAQYLIPRVLQAREILKEEGYTLRGR